MRLSTLLLVSLCACPGSVTPTPPQPDCDAGVPPPEAPRPCIQDAGHDAAKPDAGPVVRTCEAACQVTAILCARPSPPTCAATMAKAEAAHLIRTPSGAPLTCAAVASAVDRKTLAAAGIADCSP